MSEQDLQQKLERRQKKRILRKALDADIAYFEKQIDANRHMKMIESYRRIYRNLSLIKKLDSI